MHVELAELLVRNRLWAKTMEKSQPGFFAGLQHQQSPDYLWIGCADSRVPANELVGLQPGELFVHRNVANVVAHSDLNCLAVIQYAVDILKVKHVITVGHSGCGGVKVALSGQRVGLADNWVRHVRDVIDRHRVWLEQVPADHQIDAACRLNVLEQARNVCRSTVILDAWARGQELSVQGWIYGLHNGELDDLCFSVSEPDAIDSAYDRALVGVKSRYC